MAMHALKGWTAQQKHAVAAAYLGWTLDAFDFFLLVFVLKDIAAEFNTDIATVTIAVTLTLALRPLGAFIFGRLADHFGRRPVLILNIAVFSLLSFTTAFVPNLTVFLLVRAAFGIGMGGVWGIGSSLAMETIRPESRGVVSGLLQSGYSTGYLIASVVFGLLYVHVGWRGMFVVGILPAMMLIPYVHFKVEESPVFHRAKDGAVSIFAVLREHWKLALYAIMLMTAFNFFSHGTQDLYPTFLQKQHGLAPGTVGTIAIIYNIGAVLGCLLFGSLSQRFGRRRMMITAAFCALPTIWLWAYAPTLTLLTLGAFLINFFVQGCWSIIPAHLNELSPAAARSTFPGTVYQLGNLFAASNLTIQALIVETRGEYSLALAVVALGAGLAIMLMLKFGPEAHNVAMTGARTA
ncbi:MAG TPA: MFS transporter [Sphingobium sp.]|nr:MFS transporter [Sphingobium sp.]